jgi:ketosteroid isomerase-like protein
MNIKKGFSIAVVFILSTLFLSAQNKVEKSIAHQVEMLRQAMVNADEVALNDLVGEKLSYGHSAGYVEDKKEFIRKLTSGENDFVKIDLSNQTISISGNVAVVRHRLDASTQDAGKPPAQIKLLILMVWQKDGGAWKLLARQAVKILS